MDKSVEHINSLVSLLEKYTGKTVILNEIGKIRANLSTLSKIKNYISNRLKGYLGTMSNEGVRISFHEHTNILIVKNMSSKNISTVFVRIGSDLEKNGFNKSEQKKKMNKESYTVYQGNNNLLVYLPI